MNEIITVRDGDVIAAEINAIKDSTRRIMIANSILIGGKLQEAKAMVPHGEWGKWLEEKVEYSQSTANNLMLLFREYGEGQTNLFDNWTNSQAFANLNYTQHMALLSLPFSDRLEFAERVDAENLSTRELEKAVREELEKTQAERDKLSADLDSAGSKLLEWEQKAKDQKTASQKEIDRLKELAETSSADAKKYADKAELAAKELKSAQEKISKLQAEADQARENPQVSEDVMAQLRRDAETEAARKAEEEFRKKLEQFQAEKDEADRRRQEATEKLAAAEAKAKVSNPVITEAIVRAQKLQNDFNELNGFRLKQKVSDPAVAESIRRIMADMVKQMEGCIG